MEVFEQKRKKQIFLSGIMLFSGLSELISLGAVVPFLAIILDPEKFGQNLSFIVFLLNLATLQQINLFYQ